MLNTYPCFYPQILDAKQLIIERKERVWTQRPSVNKLNKLSPAKKAPAHKKQSKTCAIHSKKNEQEFLKNFKNLQKFLVQLAHEC